VFISLMYVLETIFVNLDIGGKPWLLCFHFVIKPFVLLCMVMLKANE